jgi:hypothetical protein
VKDRTANQLPCQQTSTGRLKQADWEDAFIAVADKVIINITYSHEALLSECV